MIANNDLQYATNSLYYNYPREKEVGFVEIRQLKYFLSVAEQRSFGNAAASLFVTRQAVSKAISQLEEELQVDLFVRQANGVFLTPAGVKFYDYVKHLVSEYDKVRAEMLDYGINYSQKVRIAFSIGLTELFEFGLQRGSHPNLEVTYEEIPDNTTRAMILDRRADLVVSSSALAEANFVSVPVMSSDLGILASGMWNDYSLVDLGTLRHRTLACIQGDSGMDAFCRNNELIPLFTGYDYNRLMHLAADGRCGLLIPRVMCREIPAGMKWYAIAGRPRWMVYITHMKALESNMLLWNAMEEMQNCILKTVDSLALMV